MAKRIKAVHPLDTEKDDGSSINAELSDQEQRQKLLDEISSLKTYISLLEFKIETPKFGQLKLANNKSLKTLPKTTTFSKIRDLQTELCYDLYRFTGMRCINFEHRLVFEISSTKEVTKNNLYAVEILIDDDGHGKLGKWVLPMFIDVQEILSQRPIDDLNNVKYFLKSCKHQVNCYTCRMRQLEELQDLLSGVTNASISHTIEITQIELTLLGVKYEERVLNIILYLYYNSTQTRPYRLNSDTEDKERPSTNLVKRLNKYFKPFLKEDLCTAFQQISESQTEFIWKKLVAEDDVSNIDISDEEDDRNTSFLWKFLHQDNKKSRKSNEKHNERNIENEMDYTFDIEGEERQSTDVTEDKTKKTRNNLPRKNQIKSDKHKQLMKTTVNHSINVAHANNSESNARAINITLRQEESKKRQTNTENTQMNNNYDTKELSVESNNKCKKIQEKEHNELTNKIIKSQRSPRKRRRKKKQLH